MNGEIGAKFRCFQNSSNFIAIINSFNLGINMKKSIIAVKLLILLCILSQTLNAQDELTNLFQPESVGISTDSLEQMNTYFHQLVDDQQLAGIQTAIMRHGKLIHFDSYGYSNLPSEEPVQMNWKKFMDGEEQLVLISKSIWKTN